VANAAFGFPLGYALANQPCYGSSCGAALVIAKTEFFQLHAHRNISFPHLSDRITILLRRRNGLINFCHFC
jgi:hypothetical protein